MQAVASEGATLNTIEAKDYIPNWCDMRSFLLSEAYELKPTTKRQIDSQMHRSDKAVASQKPEYCTKCGAFHRLYKCEGFKAMPLSRRWEHVIGNDLCVRCLHPHHSGLCVDPGNNKQCEACKPDVQFHNSTLCRFRVPNW